MITPRLCWISHRANLYGPGFDVSETWDRLSVQLMDAALGALGWRFGGINTVGSLHVHSPHLLHAVVRTKLCRGLGYAMRRLFWTGLAVCVLLAAPAAARAALPPEILEAGVTEAAWASVQLQVKRASAEKHISERALSAVCLKMGVALAKGRRLDLNQLIGLIDSQADKITALNQRLTAQIQDSDPVTASLLEQAKAAIEAGELDAADRLLTQADTAAAAAIRTAQNRLDNAQTRRAEVRATEAQVKALEFDYLAAAGLYGQAAALLPADDTHDRWRYITFEAGALQTRGELSVEPEALRKAVSLYEGQALALVPRATAAADWAATQNHLGTALETLGERGDDAALKDSIAAYRAALEVYTRDRDPAHWAATQNNLGTAL